MVNKLSGWIQKSSTGWVTFLAMIAFVLFTSLVLPGQAHRADASLNDSAVDVGSPDLSFTYSPNDLYRMAAAYGEKGRTDYIRVRFTFDLIWPLVYTLFLSTSISWLFSRAFPTDSILQRGNLAPVIAMLLDLLENASTSLIMYRYPELTPVVDWLAPVFTTLKWIFVGVSFCLLIAGVAGALWARIKK